MIDTFEPDDAYDARLATGATGSLREFNQRGVITAADVHVAGRVAALVREGDEPATLALALAVRAVRHGSVCVDLDDLVSLDPSLPWPAVEGWTERVAGSALASAGVVRVDHGLLYLDRYWREEEQVCRDLLDRAAAAPPQVDDSTLEAGAARLFPTGYDEQRSAALGAARSWTTVLTGGPGTGKTTAVAGVLALLAEQAERQGAPPRIALAAPTGKAAARLEQAVSEAAVRFSDPADQARVGSLSASTLHRLLGSTPDSRTRFRHDRDNRLPHDIVVVDETSMVSLTMMARLLEALRPQTRLILAGDADQLASVEAGAVLADLVDGLTDRPGVHIARLRTNHRSVEGIRDLAAAVRDEDPDRVVELLASGDAAVSRSAGDPVSLEAVRATCARSATATMTAATAGDEEAALEALERHRLLCAHRTGPYGVHHWNLQVERSLAEASGVGVGAAMGREWYAGRPILVTANDYGLGLFNGDTGVVVQKGEDLRAAVGDPHRHRLLATSRLSEVETLHAMTVHKSQGSQAEAVTVLLPDVDSPLLTRELFYTALTRAQRHVHVVGSEDAVRTAVTRRARRASGLRLRLDDPTRR